MIQNTVTLHDNSLILTFAPDPILEEKLNTMFYDLTIPTIPGIGGVNSSHNAQIQVKLPDITEKTILKIVPILKPYNFVIDPTILQHYKTINGWKLANVKEQFLPEHMSSPAFKQLWAEEGHPLSELRLRDLRIRYQYYLPTPAPAPTNLTETLAYREFPTVNINRSEHSLPDLLMSLQELRRWPILIIFNNLNITTAITDLIQLTEALDNIQITPKIGIYFRLSNKDGSEFNNHIRTHQYNAQLDDTIDIVGIQHAKCPKFLLTSNWTPRAILNLGPDIYSSSITHTYSTACDLVIRYSNNLTS